MKTPLIEFCDSNSELPFDSAQGPEQQPITSPSAFLGDRHIKLQP